MSESNPLPRQFDDAAQLYDEVRPCYPEEIIEHIIAFAALPAQARIFEVGCGTGQMTLPFARQGYTVVALDHGERLAALAAQHGQPYPQIRIVPCAFETWQDTPESYDLFLSAQAFHWIDPAYGFARAAELLKTGGTIALVWTVDRSQGSACWQAMAPIYDTYNPQTSSGNRPLETRVDLYRQALRTSTIYANVKLICPQPAPYWARWSVGGFAANNTWSQWRYQSNGCSGVC
jgi:SAM-dependent methyltransferase